MLHLGVIKTMVYIKMDAHDQLLLSEGVCRQLGVISYHPNVEMSKGKPLGRAKNQKTDAVVPSVYE